jgi:ribonuclease P protein component
MRLLTRHQYQCTAQKTFKFTGRWIVVDIRFTNAPFSRLGITATRRYGRAYQRNRFKRLVREAFRLSYPYFSFTFDMIVRPRSLALDAALHDIQNEILYFIKRARTIFYKGNLPKKQQ